MCWPNGARNLAQISWIHRNCSSSGAAQDLCGDQTPLDTTVQHPVFVFKKLQEMWTSACQKQFLAVASRYPCYSGLAVSGKHSSTWYWLSIQTRTLDQHLIGTAVFFPISQFCCPWSLFGVDRTAVPLGRRTSGAAETQRQPIGCCCHRGESGCDAGTSESWWQLEGMPISEDGAKYWTVLTGRSSEVAPMVGRFGHWH